MKKFIALFLAMLMLASFAACGGKEEETTSPADETTAAAEETTEATPTEVEIAEEIVAAKQPKKVPTTSIKPVTTANKPLTIVDDNCNKSFNEPSNVVIYSVIVSIKL